ncbi:TetR/AcrR family transcriptional regulator [Actinomycetospora atypica]|uniref:TetR/AcrR family transcriptional regulator n=1 Tax=Actinomycetospora atypica TaxID=1290095 RepID=A0ABV9YRZ6_9PSEU
MDVNAARAVPVEQPEPSRRTRKRDERRDRVYAAAVALFVEQGYEETSMDDVAARSGLSRTTVFNHFPRKAAFLEEWSRRRRQRAARSFDMPDASDRPLRELLGGYFASLAALNAETRVETKALMGISLQQSDALLGHTLGSDLADLVAASGARLRPSADARQIGRLLALGYYSAVVRWIHVEPAPFDLGDELSNLVETVLSGALTD